MKITFRAIAAVSVLCGMAAVGIFAAEPEWNPAAIKECDRACLVGFMNRCMDAIYKHDTKLVPPLALDVRMTENTGQMDVGEGMLWRSKVEPTTFNLIAADPVQGQVSLQARVKIQGRNNLIAVRLKNRSRPDSGNRTALGKQYQRCGRTFADHAAGNAGQRYPAVTAAFADDCVRHENGYQTVNNPPLGGRMMPGPQLPDPNTEQGKSQLKFSMMTCEQQISSKTFACMKHIRPRRALVIDQQKGLVAMYPLFIWNAARREAGRPSRNAAEAGDWNVWNPRRPDPRSGSVPLRDHPLRIGERLDAGLRTIKTDSLRSRLCNRSRTPLPKQLVTEPRP